MAKARFLNGQSVCFVWCEFEDSKGKKRPRLLLSTDMKLSGLDIIVAYEKRWSIEPLFNQLKNDWGMKQTWQKTRKVLHRWVHIIALGYIIPQLKTERSNLMMAFSFLEPQSDEEAQVKTAFMDFVKNKIKPLLKEVILSLRNKDYVSYDRASKKITLTYAELYKLGHQLIKIINA